MWGGLFLAEAPQYCWCCCGRFSVAAFANKFLPSEPGQAVWEGRGGLGRPKGVWSTIPITPS